MRRYNFLGDIAIKIIFLDRNAISLIKESVSPISQNDPNKRKNLNFLKKLDKKNHHIAGIFSILEGEIGNHQTSEDADKVFHKECKALGQFYKNAKVDLNVLDPQITSEYASKPLSSKWKNSEEFFVRTNEYLVSKIKVVNKQKVFDKIKVIAKDLEIPFGSFPFQLVASCLFGSDQISRKILKPKLDKKNFYNELSDIEFLSKIEFFQAMLLGRGYKDFEIEPVTFDKALQLFLKNIIISSTIIDSEIINHNIHYKKKLFPDFSEAEYLEYFESANTKL